MADCKIVFERKDGNNCSSLTGEIESVLFGLAHLIATLSYDSVEGRDQTQVELIRSKVIQYLSEETQLVVRQFYRDVASNT